LASKAKVIRGKKKKLFGKKRDAWPINEKGRKTKLEKNIHEGARKKKQGAPVNKRKIHPSQHAGKGVKKRSAEGETKLKLSTLASTGTVARGGSQSGGRRSHKGHGHRGGLMK